MEQIEKVSTLSKKYKCSNEYELPERDDSPSGFADIFSFHCTKCGAFSGNVRLDIGYPEGGFGWTLEDKQPGVG